MTSEKTHNGHVDEAVIIFVLVGVACLLLWAYCQSPSTMPPPMLNAEKLVITPTYSTPVLTLQVDNWGPDSTTVTEVTVNGAPAEGLGYVSYGGNFNAVTGGESLKVGKVGIINLTFSPAPANGTTYTITVVIAAGDSYPVSFTVP